MADEPSWTTDDLWRELERWKRELRATRSAADKPYSEHTIKTHVNHSAQFIRWLDGDWHPLGPRGS
jgi:hypothetical protein